MFNIYNDYVLYYINFGGVLGIISNFFKKNYSFLIGLPWNNIIFWARIIAIILVILFIAGIIRNLTGIAREREKAKNKEIRE